MRTQRHISHLLLLILCCVTIATGAIYHESAGAQISRAKSHDEPEKGCKVSDAWAPPSLNGATLGVAYFTIESTQDNTIIAAQSPIAKTAELHTHDKHGDIIQMRKLASVPVAANKPLVFAPSGLHIMLYNIKRPLLNNTHFPLTITCTNGGKITTQVEVSQARLLQAIKSRMQ